MSSSEETCIDDGTLGAFVGGTLEPWQIAAVEAHLASCDDCLAVVAAAGGDAPAPAADANSEAILGRFEIGEFLGRGGMGVVYHGRDRQTGQRVAIKCLEPELVGLLPEVVERFEREGDILRRLDHPNIVKMLGVSHEGERRQIVMEYVAGGSLRELLRRQSRLSVERALAIALELSDALSRAHHLGVIHRDIKPENILLSQDGTPRLSDFGLAKSSDRRRALTPSGTIVGTLAYQCPEVLHRGKYDARSDVWAFGVVLFEMLGGRRPFVAAQPAPLLMAILRQSVPDLAALRPDAPRALIDLIERMLDKDPERRPASMRQIGAALEALAGARPATVARAVTAPTPDAAPWVGRALELERLEQLATACLAGRGRVVLVTGEAGAGKTALVDQLARRVRRDAPALRIGAGHCFEHFGPSEPYAPFLEAVGQLLDGDVERAFAGTLERYAPTWCLQFPAHFSALESREYLQRVTLGAGRERMLRELGDALVAFTRVVPLCLRIEDLHWADPASVDLLRLLCRRAPESRLLVIATWRTDPVDAATPALSALSRENHAQALCDEVSVGSLAAEHVESYLDSVYAPNDFARELSLLVVRRTEGHALYTTRLIQHLWERGAILKMAQGFRLKQPASELELDIPASVRALIGSKLGSLGELERRILSVASIEGEEFTLAVLAPLLDMDERALEAELGRLSAQHRLIQPLGEEVLANGAITLRYRFAHVLYQNVFYAELGHTRKRALHGVAARLLLEHQRGEGRSAARIATHFERSGDAARAVDQWLVAGDQATHAYAYREALDCHSHALGLLEGVPVDERARRAANAHRKRAWARFHLLDTEGARREFERVLELARILSDTALEGETLNTLSHMAIHAHTPGEMERRATEALRIAEAAGDEGVALVARAQLAGGRLLSEPGTEAALEPIIQRARKIAHGPALALGLTLQGIAYEARSQYELAERLLTESLRYPTELREPLFAIAVLSVIAGAQAQLGRIGVALSTYHEALDLSRRNAAAIGVLQALTRLSWLHRELGDVEGAAGLAAESGAVRLDLPETTRGPRMVNSVLALYNLFDAESNTVLCFGPRWCRAAISDEACAAFALAEAWQSRVSWRHWGLRVRLDAHRAQSALVRGDLDAAEHHARATLDRATSYGAAKYAALAHRALAEAASERGQFARAATELERGLAWLARAPNVLVAWKLEASLARVRLELGDAAGARDAYGRAGTIIHRIAEDIPEPPVRQAFLSATADVVPRDALTRELTNPPERARRPPAAG
jgi:tetratricopeptide (TPR) repeat protein/predicted Ser/Thr protein kinase